MCVSNNVKAGEKVHMSLNYKFDFAKLFADLEDRKKADQMDSIPCCHTPKERQLAAVPELQNHQSYQPS